MIQEHDPPQDEPAERYEPCDQTYPVDGLPFHRNSDTRRSRPGSVLVGPNPESIGTFNLQQISLSDIICRIVISSIFGIIQLCGEFFPLKGCHAVCRALLLYRGF